MKLLLSLTLWELVAAQTDSCDDASSLLQLKVEEDSPEVCCQALTLECEECKAGGHFCSMYHPDSDLCPCPTPCGYNQVMTSCGCMHMTHYHLTDGLVQLATRGNPLLRFGPVIRGVTHSECQQFCWGSKPDSQMCPNANHTTPPLLVQSQDSRMFTPKCSHFEFKTSTMSTPEKTKCKLFDALIDPAEEVALASNNINNPHSLATMSWQVSMA